MPVGEHVRTHGISRDMWFHWTSKYGGANLKDLTRLMEHKQANAKLTRMDARLVLENTAIKNDNSREL